MIRINLLEVREERRRVSIRNLLIVSALSLVLTLAALFMWHQGIVGDLEFNQQQIAKTKQEISKLDTIVGEVEKAKGAKADVEQKLELIKSLEANRAEIVDLLLAVAEVLAEEVWVDKMDIKERRIELEASAVDMQSIGVLVKALKADPRFNNPRTSNIKVASGGKADSGSVGFKLGMEFVPPQAKAPAAPNAAATKK